MWIAENWRDYELLDCGGGQRLERWGRPVLVRPDRPGSIPAGPGRMGSITGPPAAAGIGRKAVCRNAGRLLTKI